MRVAYPGRLNDLTNAYKRFQENPNKIYRPSLGKTTVYAQPAEARPLPPQGVFDRMIVLRRDDGPRCSLVSALSVTAALRGAILKLAPHPVPEYLSGHAPESRPQKPVRSERPHVALVPLPFVDAPHATGDLLGIAALLPKTLTGRDLICWQVLSAVEKLQMSWGRLEVSLTDSEENRFALRPETWTTPHNVWSTVTPFVFDRYPKDPFGPEAEQIVRDSSRAWAYLSHARLTCTITPGTAGCRKPPHFRPRRPGPVNPSAITVMSARDSIRPYAAPCWRALAGTTAMAFSGGCQPIRRRNHFRSIFRSGLGKPAVPLAGAARAAGPRGQLAGLNWLTHGGGKDGADRYRCLRTRNGRSGSRATHFLRGRPPHHR